MSNFKKAKSYAAALCSRGEKCSSDVFEKLLKRGLSFEDANEIIKFLQSENYLDDSRFAESYALDKFRFNKWGKIKIKMMLSQKQLPENMIDSAIKKIPDPEYLSILEKEILLKSKMVKDVDEFSRKMKIARFAAGRGFEQDLIFKVLGKHF